MRRAVPASCSARTSRVAFIEPRPPARAPRARAPARRARGRAVPRRAGAPALRAPQPARRAHGPAARTRSCAGSSTRDLRPVALPPDGRRAHRASSPRSLGVGAGDAHRRSRCSKGARPVRTCASPALVDELVGARRLHGRAARCDRLLREGDALSGRLPRGRSAAARAQLYARLKRTAGGAPASRSARRRCESFQETLDREHAASRPRSTSLFACVIAVRRRLQRRRASRSRSAAASWRRLRVLGFTRARGRGACCSASRACSRLLAIPLGFALGVAVCWLLALRLDDRAVPHAAGLQSLRPSRSRFAVVTAAALLSGALVARRLDRLDLVAVLKTTGIGATMRSRWKQLRPGSLGALLAPRPARARAARARSRSTSRGSSAARCR